MNRFKALGFTLVLAATAFAAQEQVSISAKGPATAAINKTYPVVVTITIPEGYHIYGTELDGDLGVKTTMKIQAPAGITVGKPKFPAPHTMDVFGQKLPIYEGTIKVTVPVTATAKAPKKANLTISMNYQACNDRMCLPPTTVTAKVATNVTGGKGA